MRADIIVMILMAAVVVIICLRVFIEKIEKENQYLQASIESMQEYYTASQERILEYRKFRHDLAKHIQTMEVLARSGSGQEKWQEYLNELDEEPLVPLTERIVADDIVNTVLLIKIWHCNKSGISFSYDVGQEEFGAIAAPDMVRLLMNLLDNAIEACERIPEDQPRKIGLEMKWDGDRICLRVSNSIEKDKTVTFHTKKLSGVHGYGMRIIDDIVRKYKGTGRIGIDQAEHMLTREIILKRDESV